MCNVFTRAIRAALVTGIFAAGSATVASASTIPGVETQTGATTTPEVTLVTTISGPNELMVGDTGTFNAEVGLKAPTVARGFDVLRIEFTDLTLDLGNGETRSLDPFSVGVNAMGVQGALTRTFSMSDIFDTAGDFVQRLSGRAKATFAVRGLDCDAIAFTCGNGFSFFVSEADFSVENELSVVAPVPLPAGLPLLLAGIAGFGVLRRTKNAAA